VKDFEKTTDPTPDSPHGVIKPRGHAPAEGRDVSHVGPHSDAAALSAPELSHPANAAPLAELLTQLQQTRGNIHVQRVVAEMSEARSPAESQQRGDTQSLDSGARAEMESAFGENFGDVRIHTDSQTEKAADEIGARAFTRGRDVYFGRGEYKPSTRAGKELLAHELTHVVQQQGNTARDQGQSIGAAGDPFELEADRAAALIVRGERVHLPQQSAAAPAYQREGIGQQPPKQPPPMAPVILSIDVARAPEGMLPNGVGYRFEPEGEIGFRTGRALFWLEMPAGTALGVDAQNEHISSNLADNPLVSVKERHLVLVAGSPERRSEVVMTFTQRDKRVVVIFVLPRLLSQEAPSTPIPRQ